MVLVNAGCFSSKMNITTTCLNIIFIRHQLLPVFCLFVFVLLFCCLFVCLDFLELPEL